MNRIIKNIELDLDRQQMNSEVTAHVKQTDNNSREIVLTLRVNNTERPVQPDEHLRLRLKKYNGKAVYADLPASSDGKVHVVLTDEMLSCAGLAKADIEISSGDTILSSFMFYLDVEERVLSEEAIVDTDEYGALQTLIGNAEDEIDACESTAESVNEAKEEAQTSATAAVTAATLANQKAQAAEEAASEANTQALAAVQASVLTAQAAGSANSAASAANAAADRANDAAERLEDTDVSQLIQRINDLEAQLTPEVLKVWSCPDGDALLELWAAASGGMVEYYATLNGTFSKEEYTCTTLSSNGDGELVNLFDADPIFIPEMSQPTEGSQCASFKGILGVKDAEEATIGMILINASGSTVIQTVSANLAGHTMLHLGTVVPLGRVRSQAGVGYTNQISLSADASGAVNNGAEFKTGTPLEEDPPVNQPVQ